MQPYERDNTVVIPVANDQCAAIWKTMEPFIAQGKKSFVLDFQAVTFLNSVNIAAVIAARNKAVAGGSRIAVAEVRDNIKSVFRILKLERLFDLNLSLDQALGAVK